MIDGVPTVLEIISEDDSVELGVNSVTYLEEEGVYIFYIDYKTDTVAYDIEDIEEGFDGEVYRYTVYEDANDE